MTLRIYLLFSVAFLAFSQQAKAANGSVNITGNQTSIYIATDNASGSSFDTFTATSNSATFKKDLIGTQTKNVTNQILNFGGGTAQNDVIGLNRVKNGGNITQTNTLNISGGTIEGNILATADSGNYNGTSRRTSNNINISGGTIKGNVEGGVGATNNIITITGGTFAPSNNSDDDGCGEQTLGAIYAGVSDSTTRNQSTNGTIILKNMTGTNSFLSSFVEGTNGVSGTIFGSF